MKKILSRLNTFDYKRMIEMIKVVCKRSNHSFLWVVLDIFRCFIKYGSGYMDYFLFYFETLTDEEKETYINVSTNRDYIRTCNDPKFYHVLNDKVEFIKKYKEFIKRDALDIRDCSYDEYLNFFNLHREFMAKPVDGFCGKGIELINTDNQDPKALFESFNTNHQYLLEEKIIQNKEISSIYPHSINTIRVVTLNRNDEVKIMFSAIRIGNHGKFVDNFNNGGMFSPIDDDGVIRKPALDKENNVFEVHPMTNTPIVGFKIPMYEEIKELCRKLAFVTPELGLCGWDIAITDKGIDVVEGNQIPGYDIYQSREHLAPSKLGLKPKFDKEIYPEKYGKEIFAKGHNITKLIWIIFICFILDFLTGLLGIKLSLVIYIPLAYITLDDGLDTRPISKTILYSAIIGLFIAIAQYTIVYFATSSTLSDDPLFILKTNPLGNIIETLLVIIKTIVINIISLYFIIPAIDTIIEKIENKTGMIFTIILIVLILMILIVLFLPLLYVIFEM